MHHSPSINKQYDNFIQILKINAHRNHVYNINSISASSSDASHNSAHVAPTHNLPHVAATDTGSPPQSPSSDSNALKLTKL